MKIDLDKLKEMIAVNKLFSNSVELKKFSDAVELIEFVANKLEVEVLNGE